MGFTIEVADFGSYPPQARAVATEHLALLQRLPPVFAALLLREIVDFDWRFPAERAEIERQLHFLGALDGAHLQATMAGFAELPLSDAMHAMRFAAAPAEFIEKLTAFLWTVHQMDRFREVAGSYQQTLQDAAPEPAPAIPRLCCVVVGKGAAPGTLRLFQKLRPHGTYFNQVKPAGGLASLFAAVEARAQAHPTPYAHWYVDGGVPRASTLPTISYARLAPLRGALLDRMKTAQTSGDVVGPESLRTLFGALKPDQFGAAASSPDPVTRHFELSLLTEGSGTQIFATTFVQWAGRELLRRARPLTLVLRYAPRQVDRPMNEMLVADAPGRRMQEDPEGSLVDADMGAFYTWVNLMRLPGAEAASLIVWFEDREQALAISPGIARGAMSSTPCDLPQILRWMA